ncbi:MAG: hypothetical protein NT069_27100, partial [Planctomycetota bacterium]|nr:hypothetical protein [Planctomycetota bacterium]
MFRPGVVNQNSPHRFGRRCEEMTTPIPGPWVIAADQSQVRLVNKGGRLERVVGRFLGHAGRRQ